MLGYFFIPYFPLEQGASYLETKWEFRSHNYVLFNTNDQLKLMGILNFAFGVECLLSFRLLIWVVVFLFVFLYSHNLETLLLLVK